MAFWGFGWPLFFQPVGILHVARCVCTRSCPNQICLSDTQQRDAPLKAVSLWRRCAGVPRVLLWCRRSSETQVNQFSSHSALLSGRHEKTGECIFVGSHSHGHALESFLARASRVRVLTNIWAYAPLCAEHIDSEPGRIMRSPICRERPYLLPNTRTRREHALYAFVPGCRTT